MWLDNAVILLEEVALRLGSDEWREFGRTKTDMGGVEIELLVEK